MRKFRAIVAGAALGAMALASSANATLIQGRIDMGGSVSGYTDSGQLTTAGIGTAGYLVFDWLGTDNTFMTTLATGDFAGELGSVGTVADLDFTFPATVDPFWTVGIFSFAMDTFNIDTQNANTLILSGTGTIKAAGFDDTSGIWLFTSQDAGASGALTWSYSANTTDSVPEPGVLGLLGFGLLGMGIVARRRKKA